MTGVKEQLSLNLQNSIQLLIVYIPVLTVDRLLNINDYKTFIMYSTIRWCENRQYFHNSKLSFLKDLFPFRLITSSRNDTQEM